MRKTPFPPKDCRECGKSYPINRKYDRKQYENSQFCSVFCRNLNKRKKYAALGKTDPRTRRRHAPRPAPTNCESCGKDTTGIYRGMVLDHDHKTNQFRGWLCTQCNIALGLLNDDPEKIVGLLRYIQNASNFS